MSKRTPGPWEKVDGTDGITRGIRGWHGPEIVNVINWNGISRATSATGQANARLIAAAPDLLDALYSIVDCCEEEHGVRDYESRQTEIRGIAKAVIAKATGGKS